LITGSFDSAVRIIPEQAALANGGAWRETKLEGWAVVVVVVRMELMEGMLLVYTVTVLRMGYAFRSYGARRRLARADRAAATIPLFGR